MTSDTARSPQLLRRINSDALVRFALDSGVFTAADAMRRTGLTRATVLGVCADLVEAGWLEEAAEVPSGRSSRGGRPARRYALRASAGVVLGLDAAEHHFTVIVSDLRGVELGAATRPVASIRATGPERQQAAREVRDAALAAAGREAGDVLLSVVGVPAPVDGQGRTLTSGDYWPIMNPGFDEPLGGTVLLENDANLAAMAEDSLLDDTDSVTVLMGERIGAGVVVDGRLLRGARGGAGEMRFWQMLGGVPRAEGEGEAEGFPSLARLWTRAFAHEVEGPSVLSGRSDPELNGPVLMAAAAAGDALAALVVERMADRLSRLALVLSSLVDVDRVVVAGQAADWSGPILDRAGVLLQDMPHPVPELVLSTLGADVVARGAVASALSRIRRAPSEFEPRGGLVGAGAAVGA